MATKTRKKSNNDAEMELKVTENAGSDAEIVKSERKRPRGRPSSLTQEVADEICERLADGIPLREICRGENMPAWRTVYDWMDARPEFSAAIAHAREIGEEAIAQECLAIADTPQIGIKTTSKATGMETVEADMIEHRRLQIDTRLKLLAKWNPKKWGDKMQHTGDGGGPIKVSIKDYTGRKKEADAAD